MTRNIRVMRRPGYWEYPMQKDMYRHAGINHWSFRPGDSGSSPGQVINSLPVRTFRAEARINGFEVLDTTGSGPILDTKFGLPAYRFDSGSGMTVDIRPLDYHEGYWDSFLWAAAFCSTYDASWTTGYQSVLQKGDVDLFYDYNYKAFLPAGSGANGSASYDQIAVAVASQKSRTSLDSGEANIVAFINSDTTAKIDHDGVTSNFAPSYIGYGDGGNDNNTFWLFRLDIWTPCPDARADLKPSGARLYDFTWKIFQEYRRMYGRT